MPRPKGSKNKPKLPLPQRYEMLDDILTLQQVADWWKTSWQEIKRQVETGEIPTDCYWMQGREHKMIKRKLALLKGIISDTPAA
jgi:hypothetical protein